MKYPKSIEAALKYVLDGAQTDVAMASSNVGRPSSKRVVNGVLLDRHEYDVYLCLVDFWKSARELSRNEIMSDEEFVAFMKAAAPMLNKRMIDMALVSQSRYVGLVGLLRSLVMYKLLAVSGDLYLLEVLWKRKLSVGIKRFENCTPKRLVTPRRNSL